jgi:cysteine-rich repeat protein
MSRKMHANKLQLIACYSSLVLMACGAGPDSPPIAVSDAGPACPAGLVSCDSTGFQVKICNNDNETATLVACGALQYCAEGQCNDQVCTADAIICDERYVRHCNEWGSGFVEAMGTNCEAAGLWCRNGECVRSNTCGDGVIDSDEGCDDGNMDQTDGCLNNCVVAACGDGIRRTDLIENEAGYEACDDGNQLDTDACLNNCALARCGDGIVRTDQSPNTVVRELTITFTDKPLETTIMTLVDGAGVSKTFEMDNENDGVSGSNIALNGIRVAGGGRTGTAADLVAKINAQSGFAITAANPSVGVVRVTANNPGGVGTGTIAINHNMDSCTVFEVGEEAGGFEGCDDGNRIDDDECTNDCRNAVLGVSPDNAARSCKTLLARRPGIPSAMYWIDANGGEPSRTWCEMATDGGGWTRCQLISTNQDVPQNYLMTCRGFGAVEAMFKIYNSAEGRSGVQPFPLHILRISGNIDEAFNITDRGYSWRIADSDAWNLTKLGGTSNDTKPNRVWFDHGPTNPAQKQEMCLGGTSQTTHYRCVVSYQGRNEPPRYQYRDDQWRDNEATEIFWRE